MFKRVRRGVETIALFLCLSLSACAGLQLRGPAIVDSTLLAIDSAMPTSLLVARGACAKSDDPPKCIWTAQENHDGALDAIKVVKEWVPVLKDAMAKGDEIRERDAREHIEEAIKHIPEAYDDVKGLVLRLMK